MIHLRSLLIFLLATAFVYGEEIPERQECEWCWDNYICRAYVGGQGAFLHMQIRSTTDLALHGAQEGVTYNGGLGGAVVGFEFKAFHALYAAVFADTLTGKIKHDGVPSREVNDIESEVRFGFTYQPLQGDQFSVTPYTGIGFNYISQELETAPSYKYYQYYLPTGLLLDWFPREWITIELNFQWRPIIDNTVRVSTLPGARFTMRRKHSQYFIEMPFTFHLGCERHWDISLIPFWKRKKDGATKRNPAGVPLGLPKQAYTYSGGEVLAAYRF
ncbi:MAG TPA: hypothetical protein VLG44_03375 [Chlamydiales bacterium]|nr:hypothetical protein [Chlamydiales bacterium]